MEISQLDRAIQVVNRLRDPGGCPWDREQTHETLRKFLLEETYEVLEAIDTKDFSSLKEELGDLLLQILLHARIAEEKSHFNFQDVASALADKMIRRHPHVFGDQKLKDSAEVLQAWEKTKNKEKPKQSVLEGIPKELPALQRSLKIIEKVSKVGFQWKDLDGPIEKVKEELQEFLTEIEKPKLDSLSEEQKEKIEAELGDLFFTLSNVAFFLKINPEDAMRKMLSRFEKRFRSVEQQAKSLGRELESMSLEEMDVLWEKAKKETYSASSG